jgi:hypothetical protein
MGEPRVYTHNEIREMFVKHLKAMAGYWATTKLDQPFNSVEEEIKYRCEGVVHSALATIDGCSLGIPGFMMVPYPAPEDKEYHVKEGSNYFPDPPENFEDAVDIAGGLHEILHRV